MCDLARENGTHFPIGELIQGNLRTLADSGASLDLRTLAVFGLYSLQGRTTQVLRSSGRHAGGDAAALAGRGQLDWGSLALLIREMSAMQPV